MAGGNTETRTTGLNLHRRDVLIRPVEAIRGISADGGFEGSEARGERRGRTTEPLANLTKKSVRSLGKQLTVRPDFIGRRRDPLLPRLEHRGSGAPGIL